MIVRKAEQAIAKQLQAIAGEDAQLEATFLLRSLGFHSPYQELTETDAKALDPLIERRLSGEPLPYILGEWEFYGLPFYVDESVLIPRPDTECLVEAALKELSPDRNQVLDLCCGSGCIGVALAVRGGAKVTAADISANALDMTERNARRNGVSVELIRSDFLDEIEGPFDVIACNPPYLSMEDMENRDATLRHEPELALYGGFDGLAFYHRLAKEYKRVLKPDGTLLMEIGMTQKDAVTELFPDAQCLLDYAGRPRVLVVHRHG